MKPDGLGIGGGRAREIVVAEPESIDFVSGYGVRARELMATMLDQSTDCVKVLSPAGRVAYINRNGRCSMEIDDFSVVAGQLWADLWPAESRATIDQAIAEAGAGRSSRFEAFCPTAKGSPRWWDVSVSPIEDATEQGVFAIVSISRDITARRSRAESIETISAEMRHRLRNAYAIAGAIALASARELPENKTFAADLARRFTSLAIAQSHLIDGTGGETLEELLDLLVNAFDQGHGLIQLHAIPAVALSEHDARLAALVIGELCTNSLKHGALRAGLPIRLTGSREGQTVVLDWHEPLAVLPDRVEAPGSSVGVSGGSGQALMQRMAQAHGGSFTMTIGNDALTARLAVRSA